MRAFVIKTQIKRVRIIVAGTIVALIGSRIEAFLPIELIAQANRLRCKGVHIFPQRRDPEFALSPEQIRLAIAIDEQIGIDALAAERVAADQWSLQDIGKTAERLIRHGQADLVIGTEVEIKCALPVSRSRCVGEFVSPRNVCQIENPGRAAPVQ